MQDDDEEFEEEEEEEEECEDCVGLLREPLAMKS